MATATAMAGEAIPTFIAAVDLAKRSAITPPRILPPTERAKHPSAVISWVPAARSHQQMFQPTRFGTPRTTLDAEHHVSV
eukprot:4781319-Pyramimonas_sp.AAC.1